MGILQTRSQRDQLLVCLIAQLVEHCAGIAKVRSLSLIRVDFFLSKRYFRSYLNGDHYCDDHSVFKLATLLNSNSFSNFVLLDDDTSHIMFELNTAIFFVNSRFLSYSPDQIPG